MIEWLIENRQWFFSGAGVAIFSSCTWAILFLYRTYNHGFRSYNDLNKYVGDFDAYYFSSLNEAKIALMHFKIRKMWFGSLAIFNTDKQYTYRGELIKRGAQLYLHLSEKSEEEFLNYVLHAPLIGNPDILIGVFSAVSNNRDPIAGKVLFLRRALKTTNNENDTTLELSDVDEKIVNFLRLKRGTDKTPNNIIVVNSLKFYSKDHL